MHDRPPSPAATEPRPTRAGRRATRVGAGWRRALAGAAAFAAGSTAALAYTATLNPAAPQTVYLQIGVGAFTADYINGGQPGNNATINSVAVTLATTAVGNGAAQAMTTNSTQTQSYWDGFTYCSVPGQLYIGGFYRTTGATTAAAKVTATVPAALVDASGDTIPFSQISWTSSGNADSGAEPFPAGAFVAGGVQSVGAMASNTWNESCWTFSYSNASAHPGGTYTGRVLYTLSSP
jgi:hypothetical protein